VQLPGLSMLGTIDPPFNWQKRRAHASRQREHRLAEKRHRERGFGWSIAQQLCRKKDPRQVAERSLCRYAR
jgi:hypothetical protein